MSKKEKVEFNLPDELASIDEELEAAMQRIDQKNVGIDELLKNLDITASLASSNAAEIDDEESTSTPSAGASGA